MLDKSLKFVYVKSELLTLSMNEAMSQIGKKDSKFEKSEIFTIIKWRIIRVGVSYFVKFDLGCNPKRMF